MTFFLRLNLMEKRHEKLRNKVLQANKNLEISYLVRYSTRNGGVGQTYVYAADDASAQKEAKKAANLFYGALLSVNKSSDMFFNKKTKLFEKRA